MVWNGKTTMELRSEFVRLASQPGANKSQLCRQFEITRKTAYKWLSRASEGDWRFHRIPITHFTFCRSPVSLMPITDFT